MAVVATAAFVLGAVILWRHSEDYGRLADFHATAESRWRDAALFQAEQAALYRADRAGHRERLANGTATLSVAEYEAILDWHASQSRAAGDLADAHAERKRIYRDLSRRPRARPPKVSRLPEG